MPSKVVKEALRSCSSVVSQQSREQVAAEVNDMLSLFAPGKELPQEYASLKAQDMPKDSIE